MGLETTGGGDGGTDVKVELEIGALMMELLFQAS